MTSTIVLARIGVVGVATGIIGALCAVLMLAWPAQAPVDVLHYPFTTFGFGVLQSWYCVHHLGLVALAVGLVSSGALGASRVARAFGWLAVVGMAMLAGWELVAIRYADWPTEAANEGAMGSGYGIATTLIGLGLIGAGIGVIRARIWSGWRRFTPLVVGAWLFVVVTPGMFSGFVLARIAIGSWLLTVAALGYALVVETRARTR